MSKPAIGKLRRVGMFEALSFIVLLGVAMPLKYFADQPMAVKIVGWIHGLLFVWYCWAVVVAARRHDWSSKRMAMCFGAALIPFGPFLIDPELRREQERHLAASEQD